MLGEEGEKYRWFLLPSEAAQLLSGKNPAHFPVTVPFTPPQWKAGTSLSEGTYLNKAGCLEPCDEICTSTETQCSSKGRDKSATFKENVNNLVVDSSCVNGQIYYSNTGDAPFNNEKCDNYGNGDLKTIPDLGGMGNVVNLITNGDAIFLEASKYHHANSETENADSAQGGNRLCVDTERSLEKSSAETGAFEFTQDENALENDDAKYIESLSNEFDKDSALSTFDGASTTGLNTSTNSSSKNKQISENNDAVADSGNVCRRKPRKRKQNEVTTGKPQFHHPPKNIFKPTVQVREYLTY